MWVGGEGGGLEVEGVGVGLSARCSRLAANRACLAMRCASRSIVGLGEGVGKGVGSDGPGALVGFRVVVRGVGVGEGVGSGGSGALVGFRVEGRVVGRGWDASFAKDSRTRRSQAFSSVVVGAGDGLLVLVGVFWCVGSVVVVGAL